MSVHARAPVTGAEGSLPLKDGRPIVATVNGDAISLDELLLELDPAADRRELLQGHADPKAIELLERLVNVRLIVQEAATMGLGDLPEIRKQVDVSSRAILRDVLMEHLVKDVEPPAAAVDEAYRAMVREWKTASLLFQDEPAAARARAEIAAGASFADVAARTVAAKSARKDDDDEYHPRKDYLPAIADALAALQPGQVSAVIPIQAGFVVLTVIDVRYPENEEARAEARKRVLAERQLAALHEHEQTLRIELVTIHTDVLDSLDYRAAAPDLSALVADTRVVADIKGAEPVTVGDLTEYLRMQSFHGPDQATQRTRMNATKSAALDAMLGRRLLNMEARRLGLDKTPEYIDKVNAYEDSLVFDTFVQKVIVPDSKMSEEEVKRYYDAHLDEFSSPEMMRVRSLAFSARGAAEEAVRKLREGTDYGWMAANAEGQVEAGAPGLLTFDGRPITTDSLPEGVHKALAGAREGEYRLYASPEGYFQVLAVQAVIGPKPRPYDDVRPDIARKLYGEKLRRHVEEYLRKLRAASAVEIYLTRTP
jgi:hypothetical protein